MAEDYSIAEELKSEFRGRGAAVSGMQATPTSELMHRAEMGKDPDVNVAEQAFRENYRARQDAARRAPSRPPTGAPSRPPYGGSAGSGRKNPASDASRPRYSGPRREAQAGQPSRGMNDRYDDRVSEEIAGRGHVERGERPASASGRSGASRSGNRPGGGKKPKIRVTQTRAAKKRAAAAAAAGGGSEEIEVRRGAFPVALIALCLIAAAIIFFIVESFARVYQTSNEIARMKQELEAQKEVAAGLELKLDEKNDIRTIRSIAVGELGMAEEDSMQRRFVSVSGGERIEILETEDGEEKPGGVLLSSLGESISRFADLFR